MGMERIDKIIASQGQFSRKEVKDLIAHKQVLLNGRAVTDAGTKADPDTAQIQVKGEPLRVQTHVYLMLNKPVGYVSATRDKSAPTVLDLVPAHYRKRELFPAGRLDRDTTGLMILTDDGAMAHRILTPRRHVPKTYQVTIDIPVTSEMVRRFQEGIVLNDGVCRPAVLRITGERTAEVVLKEGRYHQIKRMFGCCGAKVVALHRSAMGALTLPEELPAGQCRELTPEELGLLQQTVGEE